MRSRLVHEWRRLASGWYFVPFQARRKPRRQDFGVRLKSCRLNLRSLRLAGLPYTPAIPSSSDPSPASPFRRSSFLPTPSTPTSRRRTAKLACLPSSSSSFDGFLFSEPQNRLRNREVNGGRESRLRCAPRIVLAEG
jgi:hypothetical protein